MANIDNIKQVTDKDEFIKILAVEYAENIELLASEFCSTDECFENSAQDALNVINKAKELTGVEIDIDDLGSGYFFKERD